MEIEALVEINVPNSKQSQMIKRETTSKKPANYEKIFKQKTGKNLNEFYQKYFPKLVWQIKSMSIDTAEAEDIAQEAFIRAFEKIDTYDPQWHFSTWLFTLGKNMGRQFKKSKKMVFVDIEATNDEDWTPLQTHIQHKTIDNSLDNVEYEERLSKKYTLTLKEISGLPDKYKHIIELSDIQGKSYNEIAEITSLPLQTVKNRIFHGRLKLDDALKGKFKWIHDNI